MKVSIIIPTCRKNCDIGWFMDNLYYVQTNQNCEHQLILVDDYADDPERRDEFEKLNGGRFHFTHVVPKPNVWRGAHRLGEFHVYALCNARNTGLSYAVHDHVISLDDTSIPFDNWLDLHLEAASKNMILAGVRHKGIYEVQQGKIIDIVEKNEDFHRGKEKKLLGGGSAHEGFTNNMSFPMSLALETNGFDEKFDGQYGVEDADFSVRINRAAAKAGIEMWYNPECALLEQMLKGGLKNEKGRGPLYQIFPPKPKMNALSIRIEALDHRRHANEYILFEQTLPDPDRTHTLGNRFILEELRANILAGGEFPIPTLPKYDWRHNKLIKDII